MFLRDSFDVGSMKPTSSEDARRGTLGDNIEKLEKYEMKYYVIDTNFIHADFFLRGTRITALARSAHKLGHSVLMPQVVFDEMCKQYNEQVDELASSFKGAQKDLYKLSPAKDQWADYDFKKLKTDYEQGLLNRCNDLDVGILKYPTVSHRDMVKRELSKRKPFKDSTKGYRDALIWETVLDLGKRSRKNDTIVLLTENTDDFADNKVNLHPDLLEDCKAKGVPDGKVKLVTDFKNFIHKEIIPAFDKLNESFDELQQYGLVGNINIHEIVNRSLDRDSVQHLFDYNPEVGPNQYAPGYYENIWVHYAALRNSSVVDVRKVTDSDVLISVRVEFDLYVDVMIFKGDLALIDDNSMPVIYDRNSNDHYVSATDSGLMTVQLNILTDANFTKLNNIDMQVLSATYDTGYRYMN